MSYAMVKKDHYRYLSALALTEALMGSYIALIEITDALTGRNKIRNANMSKLRRLANKQHTEALIKFDRVILQDPRFKTVMPWQ